MLIHESQKTLDELISSFGWTHEFLLSSSEYERCSYVQNHWVPVKSIKAHNNYCSLRQQGFVKEEIDAMIPNANVCTTEHTQPISDWTNDPSWIMNMQTFSTDKSHRSSNNSSQDVSRLEVLSMIRDAKRRRQSYRGIHTARKSYTEVLREIIAQQTEMLTAAHESMEQSEDRRSMYVRVRNKEKVNSDNESRKELCRSSSTHRHHLSKHSRRKASPIKHTTFSSGIRRNYHNDHVDISDHDYNSDNDDSSQHKKSKKHHKKHSTRKHKHIHEDKE
ncbi:U11/U12 small nuclear ribonucleoprotein 48 kDa protein isoform 2 [Schistosoma japonicum]|uniref:U11/U12 small nuclear ribonucleoprotein 48 kDa protein isoform 2 n=2 Tax=Schistosoma japonicum TaxID=6182 RepID=A0A4Z2CUR1_SCHJA|nr:U11/U12 small nuclear ribonucleoprotein 48 kDa protein isoform 2 [Schistosoma japonicum]